MLVYRLRIGAHKGEQDRSSLATENRPDDAALEDRGT